MAAADLIELWRGGIRESVHRAHAVVWDRGGIRAAWGDPDAVIFPRSSCKMIQALPLIESGAAATAGLGSEHLALACASHNGAAMHVDRVGAWLKALGLAEPDLRCGAHMPGDPAENRRLTCSDESPCQLHNNCSGKHAGFLTLNRHIGGNPEYHLPDHPVQQAFRAAFEEVTDETSPGYGIDGCSAP
ncbi:MAG TPA: asparaginase, partial [Paracoccus sp. (in: a-proteobacteria)]|nr:asparaginase [Paracoccus sp. (in: a-proteobacteria)]